MVFGQGGLLDVPSEHPMVKQWCVVCKGLFWSNSGHGKIVICPRCGKKTEVINLKSAELICTASGEKCDSCPLGDSVCVFPQKTRHGVPVEPDLDIMFGQPVSTTSVRVRDRAPAPDGDDAAF